MENVRKELLLKVQVIPSIDEEEERKTSELAERHEINVFMENVRKELPLKVQAIPSIDEEEERKTRELAEEEKVQKKIKDNVKMKVDVKRKPEGRLKRIRRRIRRLFCCVRDEHST
ncbi:uncharacterized protein LOC130046345 [Ostrea edulis]|uniref:uncharacterized protein LOC130046345 n=1 Tax=Ostrea edulis TaxID=37623 RepID=UPI0024AED5CE|nr:uncharacterized protein LOC130046345 [Ostrea edulis]